MKPTISPQARSAEYEQVSITDDPSELDLAEEEKLLAKSPIPFHRASQSWPRLVGLICATIVGVSLIFGLGFVSGYDHGTQLTLTPASTPLAPSSKVETGNCTEPYFRREWRSLADEEKKAYLDAVQCFIDSPSVMGKNGTLYDDFSWVHNLVAHSSMSPLWPRTRREPVLSY
jgi:tyrosinase